MQDKLYKIRVAVNVLIKYSNILDIVASNRTHVNGLFELKYSTDRKKSDVLKSGKQENQSLSLIFHIIRMFGYSKIW